MPALPESSIGAATRAAHLMVAALEAEGVTCISGAPGEENLDFMEALRKYSIELVVTRHEQAAGLMAASGSSAQ